jgi:hypothetical protein
MAMHTTAAYSSTCGGSSGTRPTTHIPPSHLALCTAEANVLLPQPLLHLLAHVVSGALGLVVGYMCGANQPVVREWSRQVMPQMLQLLGHYSTPLTRGPLSSAYRDPSLPRVAPGTETVSSSSLYSLTTLPPGSARTTTGRWTLRKVTRPAENCLEARRVGACALSPAILCCTGRKLVGFQLRGALAVNVRVAMRGLGYERGFTSRRAALPIRALGACAVALW